MSGVALQIAEKRREAKGKGEKERYTHLNAEFQRIEKRDRKAFLCDYELVWLAVPLVIIAFIFANYFNIVGIGRDFSQNLSVNYNMVLFFGLTIASMITASVVTIVGQISYIGLIVPNIVAMFKGDKIKGTLIDTALLGALFVLICDIIARSVIMPYELPIELIVGIIGSIMFIAMLIYKLNNGRKAIRFGKAKEDSRCG